jgi:hypothetical protein
LSLQADAENRLPDLIYAGLGCATQQGSPKLDEEGIESPIVARDEVTLGFPHLHELSNRSGRGLRSNLPK